MKYSFMSFSTPSLDLANTLQIARQYGYDGIEPRLGSNHGHGIEVATSGRQRDGIKAQAQAAGVEIACLATSLSYANPGKSDFMLARTQERIDLAGDLAVKVLRVFGGKIPDDVSREQAIDLLVSSLSSVADHAEDRGVTLCLETHDDWCDPAHVATVVSRVDRPSIAVNWDILHPVRTGLATIEESFRTLRPWIRHLHIHDSVLSQGGFAPIGTGDVDHKCALQLLASVGFDGYLSGEWIGWEPHAVHLPRELNTMKGYERELSQDEVTPPRSQENSSKVEKRRP